ncbi:uncharacterized protein BYT42DRAFT_559349 [Radiomyces spectabilis]|uniref:uncharacterized protein n=1 Tax=Radiomyces spectabilis TaxID=64574 RepID=UPI0022211510|nr:uncharacterized protein BYT42DRAFT_559349 [Radiomyces spectabilis]KAI8388226.1 hypothetical protein BYT42DRAFT_559349 [Radiomyces spectabilis]
MWMVEDRNVTDTLHLLRKEIARRNEKLEQLTDVELLVLDHIYFFAREHQDSVPGFERAVHRQIIEHIPLMSRKKNPMQFLVRWSNTIAEVEFPSWENIKKITSAFLNEANESRDLNQVIAADIIYSLAPRLMQPQRANMLEDTFAHRYLDAILEAIFGSAPQLSCDWANGSLLRYKVQQKQQESNDSSNEDDAEETQEKPVINSTVFKPDWVVYAAAGPALSAVGILELKVDYKRNPNYMTDFVKLAKEMKLILHQLIHAGVQEPIVCGILIEGNRFETFAMDLTYDGIYRLLRLGKVRLCTTLREFSLFPAVFMDIMTVKDIALKTATSVEKCHCARQLGQATTGRTPISWLRPSAGLIQRVD